MAEAYPYKVKIPATYKSSWDDGFGSRGWKINASIGDPAVIASTSETGALIPTSVFVHDIVDHHLCGLSLSGHRNEATALLLLYQRTGSDPAPDFEQMIIEDIIRGHVNGETFTEFLPDSLINLVPKSLLNDNKLSAGYLAGYHGVMALKEILVRHFFTIGQSGLRMALHHWQKTGLNVNRRKIIGLGIQSLLKEADIYLDKNPHQMCCANFLLSNDICQLEFDNDIKTFTKKLD